MYEHYLFGPACGLDHFCLSLCLPRWAPPFGLCLHLPRLLCPSLKDKSKPFSICFSTEQQAGVSKNSRSVKRSKLGRAEFSKLRLTLVLWWYAYSIQREPCFSSRLLFIQCALCAGHGAKCYRYVSSDMKSQPRNGSMGYYHHFIHKEAEASERLSG